MKIERAVSDETVGRQQSIPALQREVSAAPNLLESPALVHIDESSDYVNQIRVKVLECQTCVVI